MKTASDLYRETLGDLLAYKNAAFQALEDGLSASEGDEVLYITDFNMLYPYMWEELNYNSRPSDYRRDFFDTVGHTVFSLEQVYKNSSDFTLTISDPTLLEILDSIYHRYEHFNLPTQRTEAAQALFERITALFTEFQNQRKLGSDEALLLLQKITAILPNGSIKDAVVRTLKLMNQGTLRLLSEKVPPDLLKNAISAGKDEQSRLVDIIRRANYEREKRNFEHSTLHYSADAWNLILPKSINKVSNHLKAAFVCKPQLQRFILNDNQAHTYVRNPLAPFLKLIALYTAGHRKDLRAEADDWLREVYDEAKLRIERLNKVKDLDELTDKSLLFINKFYKDYVSSSISYKERKQEMEKESDRLSEVLKSRKSLLEHFDEAGRDAKAGSHALVSARPEIRSVELLETYDLAENPHLHSVFRKLGLS